MLLKTENAYETPVSTALDPDSFVKELNDLRELAVAVSRSNGESLIMHAASFRKTYFLLAESYKLLWSQINDKRK